MDEEISEGTSTLDDEWVKAGDTSLGSSSLNTSKNESSMSDGGSPAANESEGRGTKWGRLLGVLNRPDPNSYEWDHLFNLRSQSILRNDCRQLAKKINNTKSVPELESFFTLYCKMRSLDYQRNNGWMEIYERLVRVPMSTEVLFHIFYAVTTKFVPRDTRKNSAIYDLFRLILQYHDPAVCTKLETFKCAPLNYAKDWFNTVFASHTDEGPCHALWTHYFERGDPFLIFFMGLVLVVNAREEILNYPIDEKEKMGAFIEGLARNLTEEDVADFVELAAFYAQRTPQCIKEDFHCMIFGANLLDEFNEVSLSKLICFPISNQELLRRERGGDSSTIRYFIVDCRKTNLYRRGNVPGSFSLDCQLMVDAPDQFAIGVNSLKKYKSDQRPDDHYCFIGYGDELDDQHMVMVAAKLLAEGTAHVCVLDGGFKSLHAYLVSINQLSKLHAHEPEICELCGGHGGEQNNAGVMSLVSRLSKVVVSKGSTVKGKVSEMVNSRSMPESITMHVSAKDRHGKKYRKNSQQVFSIDGESSEDELPASSSVFTLKGEEKEKLLLTSFMSQAEVIDSFECRELIGDKQLPAHIALTRTHMHILRDCMDSPGYATTTARLLLSTVYNVTCRKKIPEVLTFKFGYETEIGEPKITSIHRFYIPKAGECAKAVKTAIYAIRPLPNEEVPAGGAGLENFSL
ncbi:hypothetical protein PFISCL1PPCAC_28015 [Pristionchus fissidentatus]|uniref:TBC1 domain family member 23 n=1 Tax=Pristionchus fissidentatus TaxID=1538716 RepID=A0AAV5X2B3_9BILA|nr:hypothetical protein PFISCL1PPCAC_28015 [Pristionchus fissidentatus]